MGDLALMTKSFTLMIQERMIFGVCSPNPEQRARARTRAPARTRALYAELVLAVQRSAARPRGRAGTAARRLRRGRTRRACADESVRAHMRPHEARVHAVSQRNRAQHSTWRDLMYRGVRRLQESPRQYMHPYTKI